MSPKQLKSLMKTCIAEVLVEPTRKPNPRSGKKMASFIRQCIAEVIVEPSPRKKKIYGNPRRLQAAHLIKECVIEVLKENLLSEEVGSKCPTCGTPNSKCNCKIVARVKAYSDLRKKAETGNASPEEIEMLAKERPWVQSILRQAGYGVQGGMYPREEQQEAFDPTSQGPNIPQENPYPEMNAKMRMLEAEPSPKEDAWVRYEKGYDAGQSHKRSGVKPSDKLDPVSSVGYHDAIHGKPKSSADVVRKTVREGDPHGRYAQQAGATPFQPPGDTSIVEDQDPEAVITKVKKEVYAALAKEGFQPHGDEPRDYVEYYLNGFMTVQVSVGYDSKAARVERYYDSEMVNNMPGHNVVKSFPVPVPYNDAFVQKFIKYAIALKRSGVGDESIFGGIDDIEESRRTQSTETEWPCPHCGQTTVIPVEIESPSDYIACADCEHCGKEISDPRLDQKVYAVVIDYYSGKADYHKDTH